MEQNSEDLASRASANVFGAVLRNIDYCKEFRLAYTVNNYSNVDNITHLQLDLK